MFALRGERVHGLRARRARQPFHGEAGEPRGCIGFHRCAVVGIEKADHDRAALEQADFSILRPRTLSTMSALEKSCGPGTIFAPGRFEIPVGNARGNARARLH